MTEGVQWHWYLCIKALLVSAAIELSRFTLISLELMQVTRNNYIYA